MSHALNAPEREFAKPLGSGRMGALRQIYIGVEPPKRVVVAKGVT
jgi:hypothetical protein